MLGRGSLRGAHLAEQDDNSFVDRCPDFAVVLDRDFKVIRASTGLRSAVALSAPGELFARTLDTESERRFRQLVAFDRDAAAAPIGIELLHRGHERIISASWRFFGLEARQQLGGIGRESSTGMDLADQVDGLRRRYQESVNQLASLTGRLRELAMVDALTGVLNRRAFLDQADGEWVRHQRHKNPLSFLMLDVDGFKKVNDTYGHAAGDALLQHIGALLRATLRATDLPARLGGDEFCALMPETNLDGATILAERFIARLASQPLVALDQNISASVSIGVANADGCASLDELMAKGDAALYSAKKAGRARVTRAE
jgi:diguanylate cyclase (GGDEF)-like protein